jgi:hypothetical protein
MAVFMAVLGDYLRRICDGQSSDTRKAFHMRVRLRQAGNQAGACLGAAGLVSMAAAGGGGGSFGAAPPPGGYYAPPPPPRRRGLSPWAWAGIGCAAFALLGFAGCAVVFNTVRNQVTQSMTQPLNRQQVLSELSGVPVYPGAQLDETMSKAVRTAFGMMNNFPGSKARFYAGAFRVPSATPEKVSAWYDTNLKAAGWKTVANAPQGFGKPQANLTEQRQYGKGDTQLVVQVGPARGQNDGKARDGNGARLILTKVSGVPIN